MATTSPRTIGTHRIPRLRLHTSCDFSQALMKLQRATQLITSTLDLDPLLDRVVNDIAASIGCVEVSVWLRDPGSDEIRPERWIRIAQRALHDHVGMLG